MLTTEQKRLKLLQDLFADHSIGLLGTEIGYYCPSCGVEQATHGFSRDVGHVTEMRHNKNCKLMELYNLI